METIDWSRFDAVVFTHFCNALLYLKFGSKFIPYSAPGKDGGIDGQYISKSENRRFQYKFKTTASNVSFSSLKSDIKKEVTKLDKEVTHYVLITNVELLPRWITEIQDLWKELIGENIYFEIWDGARLNSFYIAYPLLRHWIDENFKTSQLISFHQHFEPHLSSNELAPISLKNFYIKNRELDNALLDFVFSARIIFNIVGEAGVGKTRAVFEFFKFLENVEGDRWISLVLISKNIQFDKIVSALAKKEKYIILLDDAHNLDDKDIMDLFTIGQQNPHIKFILTSRKQADTSVRLPIKEYFHDLVKTFELRNLSQHQTKELVEHYTKTTVLKSISDEMVTYSHGKPIVIVAMLNNVLLNKLSITELKKNDFLHEYVKKYFGEIADKLNAKYDHSSVKMMEVIKILTLLEPINLKISNDVETIAIKTSLKIEEIEDIFITLKNEKIVEGNDSIMIKPDLYSDILLSSIEPHLLARWIEFFEDKKENILINLSSASSSVEQLNVLEALSEVYLNSMDTVSDRFQFSQLCRTVQKVGQYFPEINKKLINKYISALSNTKSLYAKELLDANLNKSNDAFSRIAVSEISTLFSNLLYNEKFFDFVFDGIFEIQKKYDVSSVFNTIYAYQKIDFLNHFRVSRQSYFLIRLSQKIDSFSSNELLLAIQIMTSFLKLEFRVTESSLNRNIINLSTYGVPKNINVRNMRENTIGYLLSFLDDSRMKEHRLILLKSLLDIPREIFSSKRTNNPYEGRNEIHSILSHLLNVSLGLSLAEKDFVREQVMYFILWDKGFEHTEILNEIKQELSASTTTEKLIDYLSKIIDLDRKKSYEEKRNEVVVKIKLLIKDIDPNELAYALIEANIIKGSALINLHYFVAELLKREDSFLLSFYNVLKNESKDLFIRVAPEILRKFRKNINSLDLFNLLKRDLINSENIDLQNIFLKIFSSRSEMYGSELTKDEVKEINDILRNKNPENGYEIADIIPTLHHYNDDYGREVAKEFFSYCHQRHAEYTFMYLDFRVDKHLDLLSELLLSHSYRFAVTYEIEHSMNIVLKDQGSNIIMEYVKERFTKLSDLLKKSKQYNENLFLPSQNADILFNDAEDQRLILFRLAMNWFVSLPDKTLLFFAKPIFSYLSESQRLSKSFSEVFTNIAEENYNDFEIQNRLLIACQEFNALDENFVNMVLHIYEIAQKINLGNEDLENLTSNAYVALTNTGVKIGTPGQAFSEDIQLMEILNIKLAQCTEFSQSYRLLTLVTDSVQKDIDRDNRDQNNEKWF